MTNDTNDLKEHLRQDHGIHEAPEGVAPAPDETGHSYGPEVSAEQLEDLHRRHHDESPEILRHDHADAPRDV